MISHQELTPLTHSRHPLALRRPHFQYTVVCAYVCLYECVYVCVCVCVCVPYVLLTVYLLHFISDPASLRLPGPVCIPAIRRQLPVTGSASLTSSLLVLPVVHPYIYPRQGASSAITTPSVSSGRCQMRAPLLRGQQRSKLLDLTIASDILARTKPNIYEYSCFSL